MITKTERQELRSIVKQQFRVLRSEVDQREAEMSAEVEQRLVNRYADTDNHHAEVENKVAEILTDAQTKLDALFAAEDDLDHSEHTRLRPLRISMPHILWDTADRTQFRRALNAEVEAITSNAKAQLQRQEADLLRTLAVGAIESEAARTFLEGIPNVAQLVPSQRLAELEAAFAAGEYQAPPEPPPSWER